MQLNYKHLHYFWMIARKGSISGASEELDLTPQTLSGQLAALETALGGLLFHRRGRSLQLTYLGQTVFGHADQMFQIAEDLKIAARQITSAQQLSLSIGIASSLHKLFAYRLIEPALQLDEQVNLVCRTGQPDYLIKELAQYRLDLVLTDRVPALAPEHHLHWVPLAHSSISLFAAESLARELESDFPRSLHQQPILAATRDAPYFQELLHWLAQQDIHPEIRAAVDDSALIKVFGAHGLGVFAAPTAVESEVIRQYQVKAFGRVDKVRETMYGFTRSRHLSHPAVNAICGRSEVQPADSELSLPGPAGS